ncbi:MAG TPA: DUF2345 domain-containing protein, partial [Alcaligenes sp.]|nr:DUF2345 domain-containing protein [Alcaligenes sp.]HRL26303.1 DUF2345 domain-containing protein [Alcaligenes sp.]
FARGTGVQAVAGEGPVLLQVQDDALTANAQKGMTLTSNENEVLITAPVIRLVAADGSYIKIGGGVTVGTQKDIQLLSAAHQWGGPSSDQVQVPRMPKTPKTGQYHRRFVATWAGTDIPIANTRYRITNPQGESLMEGRTNEAGETDLSISDAPDDLIIQLMED